jgi:hypothetical protein
MACTSGEREPCTLPWLCMAEQQEGMMCMGCMVLHGAAWDPLWSPQHGDDVQSSSPLTRSLFGPTLRRNATSTRKKINSAQRPVTKLIIAANDLPRVFPSVRLSPDWHETKTPPRPMAKKPKATVLSIISPSLTKLRFVPWWHGFAGAAHDQAPHDTPLTSLSVTRPHVILLNQQCSCSVTQLLGNHQWHACMFCWGLLNGQGCMLPSPPQRAVTCHNRHHDGLHRSGATRNSIF